MPQEFETPATEASSPRMETRGDPATQRVTPEELHAALAALEGHMREPIYATGRTLPLGQTVEELGLSIPPEDLWREVQAQRLRQVDFSHMPPPHAQSSVSDAPVAIARRKVHWGRWAAVLATTVIIARLLTGHEIMSVSSSSSQVVNPGKTETVSVTVPRGSIIIKNDALVRVIPGAGKTILANGNRDTLTVEGDCKQLIVTGDTNTVRIRGSVQTLVLTGDHNQVIYPSASTSPTLVDTGTGNTVQSP